MAEDEFISEFSIVTNVQELRRIEKKKNKLKL